MIKSVVKVSDILRLFKTHRLLSLTEINKYLGIPKTTLFTLLSSLEAANLIYKNSDAKYCLGIECFQLGNLVASKLLLMKAARPFLMMLAEKTKETVNLAVIENDELSYIDGVESPKELSVRCPIGLRKSLLYCTGIGKAIMANLPENKIDEIIKSKELKEFTDNTFTDPQKLKEHLKLIRTQGYAIDNMEREEGLRCIGAPIRNCDGVVFASVSIAGSAQRINETNIPELAKLVISTADSISMAI